MTDIPNLPDWDIRVEEVSAGAYRLRARHASGYSMDMTGSDLVKLVMTLEDEASKFDLPKSR